MKKSLFVGALLMSASQLFAQLPVSTSAENKNVVLEEFTGIYCTWCPAGHLLANNLKASNPGDVVLINIHTGGFAAPSGNDPDFRIAEGAGIAGQSGLTGYPAGTVNRRLFSGMSQGTGTAMSRGSWAAAGATVLGESSYVNVALEGEIDFTTNTLSVDVELYFTGSSAPSSVNLNVAVLQNGVLGPQTGMAGNPSQIEGSSYIHNHMLREMMTGQWGDVINTTTMGTTVSKTYTWTLPADINSVTLVPGDLEIAAFVAEGQQTIISGANGPITYVAPAGSVVADLSVASTYTPPNAGLCANTITPTVDVTNTSSVSVPAYNVVAKSDGVVLATVPSTAALAAGATATINFPQITLPSGRNNITLEVTAGTGLIEVNSLNNRYALAPIDVIDPIAQAGPYTESYESYALGDVPSDVILLDNTGRAFIVDQGISTAVTWNLGAYEISNNCLRMDFATIAPGETVDMITKKYDFSSATASEIQFNHAYALRTGAGDDELIVSYSLDCGATWVDVYSNAGAALATTSPTGAQVRLYPRAAEWTITELKLPQLNGQSEVMFRFRGNSAGGNALYIDNVNMAGTNVVSIEENNLNVSLYPNPAQNVLNIELAEQEDLTVKVYTISGALVMDASFDANEAKRLDVSSLSNGVYIIETSTKDAMNTMKFNVSK